MPNGVQETKADIEQKLAVSSETNQANVANPDIKILGTPSKFTMADDTSNFTKMQIDYDKTLNNFSSLSVKSPSLNLNLSRTNANDTTRPGIFTNFIILQQKEASLDLLTNQLSERNFELDNKQKSLIEFQEEVRKSQQRLENEKIDFGVEQNKYQMRETPQNPDNWSKGTIVKDVNDINPYNLSPNINGRQYLSQPVTNVNQTPVPTQQTQQPQLQVQHRSLKIDPNTTVFGRANITIDKWIFQFENTCVTNGVPENMYVRNSYKLYSKLS